MATHPNRGWRKRWVADLSKCEARHGPTGFVVRFKAGARSEEWDGEVDNDMMKETFDALAKQHGEDRAQGMIRRLLRESANIYREALAARH